MAFTYEFTQESKELLQKFLECDSPSGCESEATHFFADTVKSCCDEMRRDAMGNVTAILNPGSDVRTMISAHADEVGLQITSVTAEGMLRFRPVGGIDPASLCGQQVRILSSRGGKIEGVVARNRALANFDQHGNATVKTSEMWIDTGGKNREEVLQQIEIGDWAVWGSETLFLSDNVIKAKALDNKVGLFILSEAMRSLARHRPAQGIYAVATVQEEIGLRGMAVVAQAIKPRTGLVVDMAHATDIPGGDAACSGELSLGKGVALTRNADNTPELASILRKTADRNGIPYQITVGRNPTGGTDASRLQLFGGDTMVADISVPCRHMHTPTECCDIRDIVSAIELLVSAILDPAK